jgi:predicted HNH restriction endonuclease
VSDFSIFDFFRLGEIGMLYYFTASDTDAQKHFRETIEQPCNIEKFISMLDSNTVNILKQNNKDKYVHMWGATPGKSNEERWIKLKSGDKILAYSKGVFLYYGTIFAKTQNKTVAELVWGINKKGETWEYIYFIKDLRKVEIPVEKFNAFFGYKMNFVPQGFSNIDGERFNLRYKKYGSIDTMIETLENQFLISEDEIEEDSYQQNIQSSSLNKIKVDLDIKPEKRPKPKQEKGKKVWPRDPKKAQQALKRAEFKCEIDESHITFINEASNVPYMEAHHLIPLKIQHEFEQSLDVIGNIVSLCPNCHRMIHHAKPREKKKLLVQLYQKRKEELEQSDLHIDLEYLLNVYAIK